MGKTRGFSRNVHVKDFPDPDHFDIGAVQQELKPLLMTLIEKAFRRYARCHKADKLQEELEWTRFKKILQRML